VPYALIDSDDGKEHVDFYEREPERQLDITEGDVWADFRAAMQMDSVMPYDPSWKSLQEIADIATENGVSISRKTVEGQAKRAVAEGRMERQWQMRETTAGPRRLTVYRVVKSGEAD